MDFGRKEAVMSRKGISITALIAVLAFAVIGGLSMAGGLYIKDNVTDQLTYQKIAFAPVGSDGLPQDIQSYGGTQVTNGAQAKVFADDYIEVHVLGAIAAAAKKYPELNGVTTYSGVSGVSRANPENEELAALVQTTFRGEMLRASLLNSWGWWTFGVILFWVAIGSFAMAFLVGATWLMARMHVWEKIFHRGEMGHPTHA